MKKKGIAENDLKIFVVIGEGNRFSLERDDMQDGQERDESAHPFQLCFIRGHQISVNRDLCRSKSGSSNKI
jgi:hypothetical protein